MNRRRGRPAFSMTELLVVIAIIGVLLLLLLPALAGVRASGQMTSSMASMRQIGTWMQMYSTDHREFIVPSQFDYFAFSETGSTYGGKTRSAMVPPLQTELCGRLCGSWTDILWTFYRLGDDTVALYGEDYRYDSPDYLLYLQPSQEHPYRQGHDDIPNPFRSAAANSYDSRAVNPGQHQDIVGVGGSVPTPFGPGANERGRPGYFAANNIFRQVRDDPGSWWTTGQIRMPERSMYLVDSYFGEVIEPLPGPFDGDPNPPDENSTLQVDFRYGDSCLMLFLDGHVDPVGEWGDIPNADYFDEVLWFGRSVRVQNLDERLPRRLGVPPPPP